MSFNDDPGKKKGKFQVPSPIPDKSDNSADVSVDMQINPTEVTATAAEQEIMFNENTPDKKIKQRENDDAIIRAITGQWDHEERGKLAKGVTKMGVIISRQPSLESLEEEQPVRKNTISIAGLKSTATALTGTHSVANRIPGMTNFGIDLTKIQNIEDLFNWKMRNEGLSRGEMKTHEEIEVDRCLFRQDDFVKISEVKEILADGLQALQKRLKQSDDIVSNNSRNLKDMDSKVKNCITQVNALQKLNKGQTILFRQSKECSDKIFENYNQAKDDSMRLECMHNKMHSEDNERNKKIEELQVLHAKLKQREDELYNLYKETQSSVKHDTTKFEASVDAKLLKMDVTVQNLPKRISQGVIEMTAIYDKMHKTIRGTFKEFSDQLKCDTDRLQVLETKVRPLLILPKQLKSLDSEVANIKLMDMDVIHLKHFVERELPLLTHLQLCEGLNVVHGHFLDELKEFELSKLTEINTYNERFRGVECDIGDFSQRIRMYSAFMQDVNKGVAPFKFGERNDYWPNMAINEPIKLTIDKQNYLGERRKILTDMKLEDMEFAAEKNLQKKLDDLIAKERKNTRTIIKNEGIKERAKAATFGSKGRPPPQKFAAPSYFPQKIKPQPQVVASNADSQAISPLQASGQTGEPRLSITEVNSRQNLRISEDEQELDSNDMDEQHVYQASDINQRSHLMTVMSTQGQVVKIQAKTIIKYDKKRLRVLKKVCRTFMESQRDEYLKHQARQLELLEEQQDDMFEVDEKMIELENKIGDFEELTRDIPTGPKLRIGGKMQSVPIPTKTQAKRRNDGNNMQDKFKETKEYFKRSTSILLDEDSQKIMRKATQAAQNKQKAMETVKEGESSNSSFFDYSDNLSVKNMKPAPVEKRVETVDDRRQEVLDKRDAYRQELEDQIQREQSLKVTKQATKKSEKHVSAGSPSNEDGKRPEIALGQLLMDIPKANNFRLTSTKGRDTHSRSEMMGFIQDQVNLIQLDINRFVSDVDKRWEEILKDKNRMALETHRFIKQQKATNDEFLRVTENDLREEGFKMQTAVLENIAVLKGQMDEQGEDIVTAKMDIKMMADKIEMEYREFARNRKRWKSEFGLASGKAEGLMGKMESTLKSCNVQNKKNTAAIKMLLDTQMIDHLIQRQDVEDRKQVLLMATKGDPPAPPSYEQPADLPLDLASDKTNATLPPPSRLSNNLPDKIQIGTSDVVSENKKMMDEILQGVSSPKTYNATVSSLDPTKPLFEMPKYQEKEYSKKLRYNEKRGPIAAFTKNATSDPAVLKVDLNCKSCSGNGNMSKTMTTALTAFKHACLTYTASPIPYNNKNYHVSELLTVKASVVAQCQRMVREEKFGTHESYGKDIRNENNEKGFVIEPMINATPIFPKNRKAQDLLNDVMKVGETFLKLNQDFGATSNMHLEDNIQSTDHEGEPPFQIMKVSKYPEDIVDDFKAGPSLLDNDIEAITTSPTGTIVKQAKRTEVKMKEEFNNKYASSQLQDLYNQPTVPSLSLQQKQIHHMTNSLTRRSYYDQFDETNRFRQDAVKPNMPHMNKTPRKDKINENTIFDSNFSSTKRSQLHDQSSIMSGIQSPNLMASTFNVGLASPTAREHRAGSGLETQLPSFRQDQNCNAIQKALLRAQQAQKSDLRPRTQTNKKRNFSLQASGIK